MRSRRLHPHIRRRSLRLGENSRQADRFRSGVQFQSGGATSFSGLVGKAASFAFLHTAKLAALPTGPGSEDSMSLASEAISALLNLVVLGGLPLLVYFAYQKLRFNRSFSEVARRAGLQLGGGR